ncbi:TIGR02466 family protein [Povalibacter sp.]|uniref:TIGR02466 family protein n=1 Tax=Povalibacter sp. TaxID=1962978 RepID=UPI002F42B6EA
MPTQKFFPTQIHTASLQGAGWRKFNNRLLQECLQLSVDDTAGQRWSQQNYPGGYTSYSSVPRMHTLSPTFESLQKQLNRHVRSFVRKLELDTDDRPLVMTDCWVNIMPRHVVHGLHLHPLSTISGTYYVQTPKGSPGIKFEDPRLDRFMAAPPRRPDARRENKPWVILPAQAGSLVLFESWLRHEVAPNPIESERISISFNYGWF